MSFKWLFALCDNSTNSSRSIEFTILSFIRTSNVVEYKYTVISNAMTKYGMDITLDESTLTIKLKIM